MKLTRIKLTAVWVIPLLVALLWASPVLGEDVDASYKIVTFYEDVTWNEILAYAENWQAGGVTVVEELPLFNTLVLKVPSGISSRELADDPRVETVENDRKTKAPRRVQGQSDSFIEPVEWLPWGHYPWGILKMYDQPFDPGELTSTYRTNWLPWEIRTALKRLHYRKVRIAVFDTGVQLYHDSLYWSTKGGIDLVNEPDRHQKLRYTKFKTPIDDNGHGTYVAGIISAALDRWGNWGRCGTPVDLYAVKILDYQAMGDLSSIVMALHWAINKQIDIVNMSIGFRQDSPSVRRAVSKASELGIVMVAAVGNHSNWDDDIILSIDGGAADGGAADGGAADGGAADGGAADGGAADGGAADGGAADGGAADGGAADGGAADGGAADGGAADGGAADGGAADGGAADGGAADGGAADGGAADGGAADGGAADGGAADGGAADGGAADGGAADGGAADGGAADGGAADGGAADGGAADGGAADGGAADGGAADGGAADGGAADGGAADGGAADGGAADGGAADGGAADGGAADGDGQALPPFSVMYPARYPEVIGVGASTPFGQIAHYNNTGDEIDILAPGSNIISADVTNGDKYSGYGVCSGTSQAAAHVTAAIALMLATDASLTPDEVTDILLETSRPSEAWAPGEIDLTAALQQVREEMGVSWNPYRRWHYYRYWKWFRFFRW